MNFSFFKMMVSFLFFKWIEGIEISCTEEVFYF